MPRLSRYAIRAALLYLGLGFTIGGLMLFNKGAPFAPWLWHLLPMHIEFLLIGWTAQLILGVSFWILPRFSQRPARGNEAPAWIAFGLLNLGVWLAGVGPLLTSSAAIPFLGRLAEIGAAIAFAAHAWPRVKPLGV
jgi:hypothetical protein